MVFQNPKDGVVQYNRALVNRENLYRKFIVGPVDLYLLRTFSGPQFLKSGMLRRVEPQFRLLIRSCNTHSKNEGSKCEKGVF